MKLTVTKAPSSRHLDELAALPQSVSLLWEPIQAELERQAESRAARVRRKDGSASRLGPALLRRPSVDRRFSWRRTPKGGELVTSSWSSKAARAMLTWDREDLREIKRLIAKRGASWRP